jgi:GDPmannose 4,6-dehydratase
MDKVWLIFGCNGQDGSLMCDYLLKKGYTNIHGVIRRSSNFNTQRIEHVFDKLQLHYGDLTDTMSTLNIIQKIKPDYIINFAAQSHVKVSSELENYTFQTNTIGVLNILQSVRILDLKTRIYQAGTSEEYGNCTNGDFLLNEESKKDPVSIYGISKLASEHICNMYKNAYGMFIVSATLFNHESEKRGHTFVTQKICNHVAKYKGRKVNPLELGNLNAKRDWGSAKDYIVAVYLMLTQETPENYVIATGVSYSVKDFVNKAFNYIGIEIEWSGDGMNQIGVNKETRELLIKVNPKYYRDLEINHLVGDSSKAKKMLGWEPKVSFDQLVKEMMDGAIDRCISFNQTEYI